jgi:hypothetical protein
MAVPNEVAAVRRAGAFAAFGAVRGINLRVGCVVVDARGEVALTPTLTSGKD